MKITAYEVRPDEKDYLLAAAQQEQIEITLVQGPMTQDNIDRAEGEVVILVNYLSIYCFLLKIY